jgi:hypothetical protein
MSNFSINKGNGHLLVDLTQVVIYVSNSSTSTRLVCEMLVNIEYDTIVSKRGILHNPP